MSPIPEGGGGPGHRLQVTAVGALTLIFMAKT